jgi:Fic family protein
VDKASGRFEPQIGGHKAFLPDPLPPSGFVVGPKLQATLSRADRALGRLDGSLAIIPDANRFVAMFVTREAVLSSQIEGTHASLADVLEHEALMASTTASMDLQEVINYVAATNHGIELLDTLPVSGRLIREVHAVLMDGVRGGEPSKTPGEFRRSQNWIGGATPASARFVPPPWEDAQKAFAHLEQFMNEPSDLPPLIVAGLIHAQFETIHPFLDGNGRTGRLLITFWLIANEVLTAPVLYPSLYLKREQEEYVRRLQATREQSAWEDWLLFFLDAVAAAAEEATAAALSIVALRHEHQSLIAGTFGRRSGIALGLLSQLFSTPIVNARSIESTLGLSQPTASSLLKQFEQHGILTETTGKSRNRRYTYDRYLQLFPGAEDRS